MDEPSRIETPGGVFWDYQGQRYPEICRLGNACAQIQDKALQYCQGKGLDIGAGNYPLGNSVPVKDHVNFIYRGERKYRRPEPKLDELDAYNLKIFADNSLDYIFSSHCLEHLDRPEQALKTWAQKLKPGGILFLYLPHSSMLLWRPGSPWVKDGHKWVPEFNALADMLAAVKIEVIAGESKADAFYSFFMVGIKNG